MKKLTAAAAFVCGALITPFLNAQYHTGAVYSQTQFTEAPQSVCGGTVYDPEIFVLPDQDLQMLAQGPHNNIVDKFYAFRRENSNGQWSGQPIDNPATPGADYATPAMAGQYARCGYAPSGSVKGPGPIASPSVVHDVVADKYFMAYSGGNADGITGRLYWATSTDGLNWTHYSVGAGSQLITPIVYPFHHEICDVDPVVGGSGIGQVEMVLNGGYFMIWLRYGHDENDPDGTLFDAERIAFRISYDSNSASGLGSTRQIWYDGQWRNHSGKLVWNYDRCNGTQCPAQSGDFILAPHQSVQNMKFGAGDIKYDPTLYFLGYWVHFAQESIAGDPIEWEYSDLTTPEWTHGGTVDLTTVYQAYPNAQIYYPGLYFYSAWEGGLTGDYLFIPLDPGNSCTAGDFAGLRIVATQLLK